jgi:hypothetical protein
MDALNEPETTARGRMNGLPSQYKDNMKIINGIGWALKNVKRNNATPHRVVVANIGYHYIKQGVGIEQIRLESRETTKGYHLEALNELAQMQSIIPDMIIPTVNGDIIVEVELFKKTGREKTIELEQKLFTYSNAVNDSESGIDHIIYYVKDESIAKYILKILEKKKIKIGKNQLKMKLITPDLLNKSGITTKDLKLFSGG